MHQQGRGGRSADEFDESHEPGLDPSELSPFIAGAPRMGLVKQGGGLRPIAIGETIRRLVSKCCCEATTEDAKIIFGPLQVGVATQGGAEASVHAARKLAKEFGEDPCSKWIFRMCSTWWTGLRCSRKFMRGFLGCTVGSFTVTPIRHICSLGHYSAEYGGGAAR